MHSQTPTKSTVLLLLNWIFDWRQCLHSATATRHQPAAGVFAIMVSSNSSCGMFLINNDAVKLKGQQVYHLPLLFYYLIHDYYNVITDDYISQMKKKMDSDHTANKKQISILHREIDSYKLVHVNIVLVIVMQICIKFFCSYTHCAITVLPGYYGLAVA